MSVTNSTIMVEHVRTSGLGGKPVQRVVTLALRPNLTADSECCRGGKSPAVGIDISNANLHRGVILGGDQSV